VLQNEPWLMIVRLFGVKFHGFEFIGEMTHDHWRIGMPPGQWHSIGQWRGLIGE
jgi:hypothetical protein